jgi:hypothetical protein
MIIVLLEMQSSISASVSTANITNTLHTSFAYLFYVMNSSFTIALSTIIKNLAVAIGLHNGYPISVFVAMFHFDILVGSQFWIVSIVLALLDVHLFDIITNGPRK